MKRFKVLEVKCDAEPLAYTVTTAIRYDDGDGEKWFYLADAFGLPNAYVTEEYLFEEMIDFANVNDDLIARMDKVFIKTFHGVPITQDYNLTFDYAQDHKNDALQFVRYAIYVTRCDMEDLEDAIKLGEGHYIDEIEVPISDVEQEYIDDHE